MSLKYIHKRPQKPLKNNCKEIWEILKTTPYDLWMKNLIFYPRKHQNRSWRTERNGHPAHPQVCPNIVTEKELSPLLFINSNSKFLSFSFEIYNSTDRAMMIVQLIQYKRSWYKYIDLRANQLTELDSLSINGLVHLAHNLSIWKDEHVIINVESNQA